MLMGDVMSQFNYIDEQYIKQMNMYTELFTDLGNDTYNCRCPICGDSAKSKLKARGFFYKSENGNWRYKCHNCAINISFYDFIEKVAPSLVDSYKFEVFTERKSYNQIFKKRNNTPKKKVVVQKKKIDVSTIKRIDMSVDNEFTQYLKGRGIPIEAAERLYYTEDIEPFVRSIESYDGKNVGIKKGILIPYFNSKGKLNAFQIRNVDKRSKMRYLTYDISDSNHIYNLNKIIPNEPVYVFEGAFDSMFCVNGVAASGSSIFQKLKVIESVNDDVVVVFDNDYKTNPTIYDLLMNVISKGYKVVLFDNQIKHYKDINEFAYKENKGVDYITAYLKSCTMEGLQAELYIADIFKKINAKRKTFDVKIDDRSVFEKNDIFSI